MKKILSIILAAIMLFALVGCGGGSSEATSLVEVTTEEGITLLLPSDLTLQTIQERPTYINTETGDNAVFGISEVGSTPLSAWAEENILATFQSQYADAAVQSFETGIQINGKDAFVSSITFTTPGGNAVIVTLVMITDGTNNYIVSFTTGSDTSDSTLAANLQACIDSITIAE